MVYRATHVTTYRYDLPVSQCLNEVRLTPRRVPGQRVRSFAIEVAPEPAYLHKRADYFGNEVTVFSILDTHEELTISATSVVEVDAQPESLGFSPAWEEARAMLAAAAEDDTLAASEFVWDSPFVARSADLAAYAAPSFAPGRPLFDAARELCGRIRKEFEYEPKATSIETPLRDVLRGRKGVCQDFAHVMIGGLRSLGLAARYVSGYIRGSAGHQGAEASHAWVAVYVPGSGWIAFDPTNDMIPGEQHITLAWGRDYGDVTPVKGTTLGGGRQTVEVEVRMRPLAAA